MRALGADTLATPPRTRDGHSGLHFTYVWSREYEEMAGFTSVGPTLPFGPPVFDRSVLARAVAMPDGVSAELLAASAEARAAGETIRASITDRQLYRRLSKLVLDFFWSRQATVSLRIPAAAVKAARAAGAAATGVPLSANDVCVGVAWATLRAVRARGPDSPPRLGDEHFACQTVDLRRFLPIGDGYFGNTAWFVHMTAPQAARSPADFAAACRSSLSRFSDSTLVFEQAAMLSNASERERGTPLDADTARTFMLPLFGDGMFSRQVTKRRRQPPAV